MCCSLFCCRYNRFACLTLVPCESNVRLHEGMLRLKLVSFSRTQLEFIRRGNNQSKRLKRRQIKISKDFLNFFLVVKYVCTAYLAVSLITSFLLDPLAATEEVEDRDSSQYLPTSSSGKTANHKCHRSPRFVSLFLRQKINFCLK